METRYSNSPAYNAVDHRQPWSPGIFSRLPWLGIAALTGAALGVAASIAILTASNGKPISSWSVQPTVYLAIAATLTNIMLHFALSEGINVAWWRRAMKEQTQVGDLHRYWDFGNSVWAAATAGRKFNLIAVACILTAIAPINNPLLQRASKVSVAGITSSAELKLPIAPIVPDGYTGHVSGRQYAVSLLTANFSAIVQKYSTSSPITLHDTGCNGVCSATVKGAGLSVNCSSYSWPFDLRPQLQPNGTYDATKDPSLINGTYAFMTSFPVKIMDGNGTFNVQYKDTTDCSGNLRIRNCSMQTALVQYPVIIDSNKSTITLDPSSSIFDDVIDSINHVQGYPIQGPTTMGGFWRALGDKYDSTAHLRFVGAVGYELLTVGSAATQYAVLESTSNYTNVLGTSCSLYFTDPTNDLLASARELMFRTALGAANSSDIQIVSAIQTGTHAVYESHYAFLAIAVAVTAFAISVVTMTFNGYWHLGRTVTMSPIEIAKAFNAPSLKNDDSNASATALVKELGDRSVRYGSVLAGDDQDASHAPKREGLITTTNLNNKHDLRLELADETVVQPPTKGSIFSG